MSKSKTTIYDVARYLGVSIATVNRALNNKPEISEETREKVIKAAQELNYRPSKTASTLNKQPKKIAILMPLRNLEFVNEIKAGVIDALKEYEDYNFSGDIIEINAGYDQKNCVQKMYECAKQSYNAMIVYDMQETSLVKIAMEDISQKYNIKFGVGLSAIDTPSNLINLQVDGYMEGAMAAELLENCLPEKAKVAMITGFSSNTEHGKIIKGFTDKVNDSRLDFKGIYEHNDDDEMAEWIAENLVKDIPDINGIFISTAKSIAFCNRLKELGYGKKLKIIAADMFPEVSELMNEGIVMATIFKSPYKMGYKLVKTMFENLVYGKSIEDVYEFIEPRILLNSNKMKYLSRSKRIEIEFD